MPPKSMLLDEGRDGAAAPFRLSHDARSAPASGSGDPASCLVAWLVLFSQLLPLFPPRSTVVPFRRITLPVFGAQPAALHAFSFASAFRMHFRSPESSACIFVR